jgi:pimeloyl-ACP methyl ester carboxylesterase
MPIIQHPACGDLSYSTSGEGSTALLLLHGWAGSAAYFETLVSHLDPELTYCVSLDLPGHGFSGEPVGDYTLDGIADVTFAVADAAGADTFVLLGYSMSAKFAQYVAHRHHDRLLGQILVSGAPAGPLPLPADLVDDWCARAGDADQLVDVVLSTTTRPIDELVLKGVGHAAARVLPHVLRGTVDLCIASDFLGEITGSSLPTLVVGGAEDWVFPPAALRDGVVAPLARARLELIGCGHEIPLEAPAELAGLISTFVTQLTTEG